MTVLFALTLFLSASLMFIVEPMMGLSGRGMISLFSTHPPIAERVRRLRTLDDQLAGYSA